MAFEARHTDLLERYARHFGLPPLNDDKAREWTFRLGQQFAFTFPGDGWGTKSAGNGRPQSTDVIARQSGGRLLGYDVIGGQGSAGQVLISSPGEIDITGQVFVTTPAKDWLANVPGEGPGPGTTPTKPPVPSYDSLGGDETGRKISRALDKDFRRAGRPGLDAESGMWAWRVLYDHAIGKTEPTIESSIAKHRVEWCASLGIPVA